ncbi:hypothetical protein GOP47_0000122 [Adiantum capillus-veneris]|uniref:Uncharacterized protein n=1 Tax=Adiantum capillus-veneris TaxID=13818 RepID=A0A9D4VCZ2_ADICA|nr:hypothetical protein GOP47_0000122 [Adiantum capillus-veneris]
MVGKMGGKVVNGASACVDCLEPSTHNGQYSESTILYLLSPKLLDFLRRTRSPTKRVEPEATEISNICAC